VGLDFRGRRRELAALQAGWAAASGGEAPVIVVHGEPGIGKTRLVSELAGSVRTQGAEVLWGTCHEGALDQPYGVWADAARSLIAPLGDAGLQQQLGDDVRWLAPLTGAAPSPDRVPATVSLAVARLRLAEVFTELLQARTPPPLVVLDDMQWANPDSLELFGHLVRLATGTAIVVIFRGNALELGHPLAQRLAEVGRVRACEYLHLGRLERRDAAGLLQQAADRRLDPTLEEALYARSDGNPFFLAELGRYLGGHGELGVGASGVRLPESIRAAVGLRIARLSAETRRVVQLASVFTAGFGFEPLQMMADLPEEELLDCLEQALAAELLRPIEGERYDFVHALVRQTLYEQMSVSRRVRLHRRLAVALEQLHAGDPDLVAAELVQQYHSSASLAGADRGAALALPAAERARAAGAPADAAGLLRLGLDLVSDRDGELKAQLLSRLALAAAEAGLLTEASLDLEAAVDLLGHHDGRHEEIAELVYSVGVAAWVDPMAALRIGPLIERALDGLGAERNLAWARLKLVERSVTQQVLGDVEVLEWAHFDPEAVMIARTLGTEADYASTVNGWFAEFGDELEELIARMAGWTDPAARLQALVAVVGYLTLLEPGRSREITDLLCADLRGLADDVGLLPHRSVARVLRATMLGTDGQFAAAAQQLRNADDLFSGQPPAPSSQALVALIAVLTEQHLVPDWPMVATTMWRFARSAEHFAGWLSLACAAIAARAEATAGDENHAREILEQILPALAPAGPLWSTASNALGLVGDAVWELRDAELARALLPAARRVMDGDARAFYMTSPALTVGRLSALAGSVDEALQAFAVARATLESRGQVVLRAVVDHDEAVARIASRRPGAGPLLASARTRFTELGMQEWMRRSDEIEVPVVLPDQLTAREAEILRLVGERRTNREIASELVISVHTVERHVQNVYRKIGVSSRAEAGTYVARVGL
jgi:DNA-binding CsgD family transcriptional regulator